MGEKIGEPEGKTAMLDSSKELDVIMSQKNRAKSKAKHIGKTKVQTTYQAQMQTSAPATHLDSV